MPDKFDSKFIKKVADMIETLAIQRMDKIAIKAHNNVSIATPTDLGQAHAGFNFTLNARDTKRPPKPKRPKKGEPKIILPVQPSVPNSPARKLGDKYLITNTVAHIVYLNEGTSSQQGDPNYIEREVVKAVKDIEGAK